MINWNGYQDYLLEMTLPTQDDPHAIVNFSDAGTGAHASPSFWIARRDEGWPGALVWRKPGD